MILLLNVNSKAVNAISKWCTWYMCMLIANVNTFIGLFPREVFQFQFRAENVRKSLLFYSGTVLLSSRIFVRWSVEILSNNNASDTYRHDDFEFKLQELRIWQLHPHMVVIPCHMMCFPPESLKLMRWQFQGLSCHEFFVTNQVCRVHNAAESDTW